MLLAATVVCITLWELCFQIFWELLGATGCVLVVVVCAGAAATELLEAFASISKDPVSGSVPQILWSKDTLPFSLQLAPEGSVIIPIQLVLGRNLHCLPAQVSAPSSTQHMIQFVQKHGWGVGRSCWRVTRIIS